jgi:hypothetical protein
MENLVKEGLSTKVSGRQPGSRRIPVENPKREK